MKKFLFAVFVLTSSFCFAQSEQNADTLRATAKTFIQQGDYDNAVLVLTKATQMQPNDPQITKDLLFAYYLKRDFAKAMEIGKPLVERKDTDVQIFQLLGLTYKAIAAN